jgi:hypothetical protein
LLMIQRHGTNRRNGSGAAWRPISVASFLLIGSLGALPASAAHSAGAMRVSSPVLVTGKNPLPAYLSPGYCGSDSAHQDWEEETAIAVNPGNPSVMATAWIQDWADAIAIGYSTDGGHSWTTALPPTTQCTGGIAGDNSDEDEGLAFGPSSGASAGSPHQTLYLVSTPDMEQGLGSQAIVNVSTDGGATWSSPATLDSVVNPPLSDPLLIDVGGVATAPSVPGRAYAIWNKGDVNVNTRTQYVSRTDDGGMTWSSPMPIQTPGQVVLNGGLHVLSDGSLVDVYCQVAATGSFGSGAGPTTLKATRSFDEGAHWTAPVTITVVGSQNVSPVSSAAAPDGTVYVGWTQLSADGSHFSEMYARSRDGGRTWQKPGVIATEPGPPESTGGGGETAALLLLPPILSVAPDGTVGAAFYDHRNAPSGTNPLATTDYWFRYSTDRGGSWTEWHVAGPFDQSSVPEGGFIGDYQGLSSMPGGLALAYVLATPLAATPPTDVYFSTATR